MAAQGSTPALVHFLVETVGGPAQGPVGRLKEHLLQLASEIPYLSAWCPEELGDAVCVPLPANAIATAYAALY